MSSDVFFDTILSNRLFHVNTKAAIPAETAPIPTIMMEFRVLCCSTSATTVPANSCGVTMYIMANSFPLIVTGLYATVLVLPWEVKSPEPVLPVNESRMN